MQPALSLQNRELQAELREFFESIPGGLRRHVRQGRPIPLDVTRSAQLILHEAGLATPAWPEEWGGRGWSPLQLFIWESELQRACVPPPLSRNVRMIGPTLAQFASPNLKRKLLPPTARLDIAWCQGFSEPDSGSDLASLRTTAVRDGDTWVVNGQKTWTTAAQHSDWMFALVRTDPAASRPQAGISLLVFDMDTPGVDVRPIRLIDGSHEVCEVFLTDVRVPHSQVVGEPDQGWRYAKYLLGNERIGVAPIGTLKRRLAQARRHAATVRTPDGTLAAESVIAERLSRLEADLMALELTVIRVLTSEPDRSHPVASVLKLSSSELQQCIDELVLDLAGGMTAASPGHPDSPNVAAWAASALPTYLNFRKATIYGGSSEIQREIISRSLFAH